MIISDSRSRSIPPRTDARGRERDRETERERERERERTGKGWERHALPLIGLGNDESKE